MANVSPFSFRDLSSTDGTETVVVSNSFVASGNKNKKEEAPPAPPPPPTFSEEELKAAERDGYQKGFLEGIKEGQMQAQSEQAEVDRVLTEKTDSFVAAITPLFHDYRKLAMDIRGELPRVAMAIAEKMLAQTLSEDAAGVIQHVAMQCCEQMVGEPKLTITVHESLAATLNDKLQAFIRAQAEPMQISVSPSADIGKTDCRVEWAGGVMERQTEKLWQSVSAVIEDMQLMAKRDTDQQLTFLAGNLPITAPLPEPAEPVQVIEPDTTPPEGVTHG